MNSLVCLTRDFYLRDTLAVAKELIGCKLAVLHNPEKPLTGTIIETEAYLGKADKACHSYKASPFGRTNIMYGKGGYAYVYLIYGMYYCLNAVTRETGEPEAVLIRGILPDNASEKSANGPGKLTRFLAIDKSFYGMDLTRENPSKIFIAEATDNNVQIRQTTRIGVDYAQEAADFEYRFYDNRYKHLIKGVK